MPTRNPLTVRFALQRDMGITAAQPFSRSGAIGDIKMSASRTAMVLGGRGSLRSARGDPIFGLISRFALKVAPFIRKGIGALTRGASKTSQVLTQGAVRLPGGIRPRIFTGRAGRIARVAAGAVGAGAAFEVGGQLIDAATGQAIDGKKKRRMNVLNPRALSRSVRRLAGFNRRSKSVAKQLRRLAPPSTRRPLPQHGHLIHKGPHVLSE